MLPNPHPYAELELGRPPGSYNPKGEDGVHRPSMEQNTDDWLPVTGSRNAKWWYSTFHNVSAIVGAGVLGLPAAMMYLGWAAGVTALVVSWTLTLYTLWQMVEMHECIPGKRLDRYHELGQEAFGEKLGLYIVVPLQIMVEAGVDIVYMVTGGLSLQKFYRLVKCHTELQYYGDSQTYGSAKCGHIGLAAWIVIFASPHFLLAQLPNLNSISGLSLAAAVMSLSYSTIAWVDTVHVGRQDGYSYHLPDTSEANLIFKAMSALGVIAFAYAGHNVVLEIQATLPSTRERPSKIPMWRGVRAAYIVVAACYFPVAITGYWAYGSSLHKYSGHQDQSGDQSNQDILTVLGQPKWLIATANMMVVIHVTGSYQLYAMPVFDMLETVLVKKLHMRPTLMMRVVTRSTYVLFTAFVACTFPFFEDLLGFFGGLVFAPTTYFLPCIIWLKLKKPRMFGISWFFNWFCIIIGVLLSIVSSIGGMRGIIVKASTYKFYQFHQ